MAITGVDPFSESMGLYEVDLETGENRRLGGALLASGFTLMPALSPDGSTLAVLHKGAAGRLLETRVCLVDLGTGEARAVGEPHDLAFPSWLPDGKGLVLLLREVADPSDVAGPRTATIARMDLEGRLTRIREGGMPVLLNDGKTILFQDTKARTWQACGLDGGDPRPYAGGLPGYGFPSPAPDGKRIIMMRFRQGVAPEPTILPIGGSDGKPALTDRGSGRHRPGVEGGTERRHGRDATPGVRVDRQIRRPRHVRPREGVPRWPGRRRGRGAGHGGRLRRRSPGCSWAR